MRCTTCASTCTAASSCSPSGARRLPCRPSGPGCGWTCPPILTSSGRPSGRAIPRPWTACGRPAGCVAGACPAMRALASGATSRPRGCRPTGWPPAGAACRVRPDPPPPLPPSLLRPLPPPRLHPRPSLLGWRCRRRAACSRSRGPAAQRPTNCPAAAPSCSACAPAPAPRCCCWASPVWARPRCCARCGRSPPACKAWRTCRPCPTGRCWTRCGPSCRCWSGRCDSRPTRCALTGWTWPARCPSWRPMKPCRRWTRSPPRPGWPKP